MRKLLPLVVVSLVGISYEIALTRYFAIANWSEYGYWVISIAMLGLSASGVILSIFKNWILPRSQQVLAFIPSLLMISAALGFYAATLIDFNPLELQNSLLWVRQLSNIGKYYLSFFPFFFLTGTYIGVYFLNFQDEIPTIYAADLIGAGLGALLILGMMVYVHPFYLVSALVPLLAAVSLVNVFKEKKSFLIKLGVVVIFVICETLLIKFNKSHFNEYKSIFAPLQVADNRVLSELKSPKGYYLVLDNFTERVDVDISNNSGAFNISNPPQTLGLYKDGNRLTSLPKSMEDVSYVDASLDSIPYKITTRPRVQLIGTKGGFRIEEAVRLGAESVLALEPDSILYEFIQKTMRERGIKVNSKAVFLNRSTGEIKQTFDILDISSEFLDQSFSNRYSFTAEAFQNYFEMLSDEGLISIPVSIREFSAYAVKVLNTVRWALDRLKIEEVEKRIIIYRSAWGARILVSKVPFTEKKIEQLRSLCDQLSFDVSYFPNIDPNKIDIWNELPLVSFQTRQVLSDPEKPADALMDMAVKIFKSPETSRENIFFNLEPITLDRPFFYGILKLTKLHKIIKQIAILPREEIGFLINLAILTQAVVLAVLVLFLPLIRWRNCLPKKSIVIKSVLYFASLGLGFLFLEIMLIEKASFFLNDPTSALTLVLTGMLMFSGMGSYWAGHHLSQPFKTLRIAALIILLWITLSYFALDWILLELMSLSFFVKCILFIVWIAPLSIALGIPFPLGLYQFRKERDAFLPWAWSLNGAFSVLATPLANILGISCGYGVVLILSGFLYFLIAWVYPEKGS